MISAEKISDFLCSTHSRGRYGFSPEGFDHYIGILNIISNKFFNPDKPESNFVESCFKENWEKVRWVADTRNKEAIEYCDLFKKFVKFIKSSPEYIQFNRNKKIENLYL